MARSPGTRAVIPKEKGGRKRKESASQTDPSAAPECPYGCRPRKMVMFFNQKIKGNMTEEQEMKLNETPFAHLFQMPPARISISLFKKILNVFDPVKECFIIGDVSIPFTVCDVGLALGLKENGRRIRLYDHDSKRLRTGDRESRICKEYFRNKSSSGFTCNHLEEKLVELVGTANVDDFIILMILYAFSTVLFPSANKTVNLSMVPFVEDLDALSRYAWADAVHDTIIWNLTRGHERKGKIARAGKKKNYIAGCSLATIVCFLERCGFKPFKLKLNSDGVPRPSDILTGDLELSYNEVNILAKGCQLELLTTYDSSPRQTRAVQAANNMVEEEDNDGIDGQNGGGNDVGNSDDRAEMTALMVLARAISP